MASLSLPPLRDRPEDIPILFSLFVENASERFRRPLPELDDTMMRYLLAQSWAGNVRELRNVAERFVLGMPVSGARDSTPQNQKEPEVLTDKVSAFERETIRAAMIRNSGRVGKTAEALGIPRKRLYLRMQKYGLDPDQFK